MQERRDISRKNFGFTLPELLMGAMIFGFSLSVILYAFIGCISLNETSRNLTKATQHAQFVLEEMRNTAFANVSSNISSGTWNWDASEIAGQGLEALNAEVITVTSLGTTVLDITITVTWYDSQRRSRSLTLISSRANV